MGTMNRPVAVVSQRDIFVDQLMNTPAISANGVSTFLVLANANTNGVDVSFNITDSTGIASVTLLRAAVQDIAQAIVLQTWSASASGFTWSDTDKLLQQMGQAFYWLKLEPANVNGSEVVVGPQFILLNPSLLPPLPLTSVSASHSAASNGVVLVTCNVSAIPQGDSVKIQVTGYLGNPSPVAVTQKTTAPLQFNLEATGETITITALAVSPGGSAAPSGPTCTLTLNGSATVPAQIQNVLVSQLSTGNQVQWPSSLETGVTSYNLYRGQRGGGFGAASLLSTIAATTTGTVITLDATGLTGDYEYFVVAVAGVGNSSPSNAANPIVLYSSSQIPANATSNTFNNASIDSILVAGPSATIRIYGPGGVGTSYSRLAGFGNLTRPSGSITGLSLSTLYFILYTPAGTYLATTTYSSSLPDGYEWVGSLTTISSGGSGGASCALNMVPLGGGNFTIGSVTPVAVGYGYGTASVTVTGGVIGAPTIIANCTHGQVTSYSVANGGTFSTSSPSPTVNLLTPYTGGGGAQAGSRYVLNS